jgi:molybdenum cofactor synthesis domain-containing protein
MIRVAVLTISDSARAGLREDASGPAVRALCERQAWTVALHEVLADERHEISARLAALADGGAFDVIITTGGTGITPRDVTPEATRDVLHKELPGLVELMRAEGLKKTRRAVLSRASAGTRGKSLILNVPGSPKGAAESLDAILDLVPHIVELLRGNTAHGEETKRD